MKKIPLVIKTWAGDAAHDMDYIQRSIPSLLASRLPDNIEILIYDDCSPNTLLREFLLATAKRDKRVRLLLGEENKGPNRGQQDIYQLITEDYPDTPYYLNADDDVVYHHAWLTKLDAAYHQCRSIGLNGIFSAIHMPFRKAHSQLQTQGNTYLLKWAQPALNWLIPVDLYQDIGPFIDEGIAYDTVYGHWMRLKQRSIICMTPSYVQNIGLLGAYAFDDTTTSTDFIGEGKSTSPFKRMMQSLRYHGPRIPHILRRQFDDAAQLLGPVRWGSEFVHEGVHQNRTVAIFSFIDAHRLGWSDDQAAARAQQIQAIGDQSARISAIRRNRSGKPVWVECDWQFSPNLRELRQLNPARVPTVEQLFQALILQIRNLHQHDIAHNKIRQDNVYFENEGDHNFRLTWLGTEPHPGTALDIHDAQSTIKLLSGALNRWAQPDTEEMFAARYLECVAPEIMRGEPATLASDLYSVAALSLLAHSQPNSRLRQIGQQRQVWESGNIQTLENITHSRLREIIHQCLNNQPNLRPTSALDVAKQLGW